MRALYYTNFALQGLPSLRSLDGQPAIAVGDPQFRSGQFWNRSRGQGIELAEATTNLVIDGDFNSVWTSYGSPTKVELTGARSLFGPLSCHVICDNAWEGIYQGKNLSASTQYTISAYIYADSGSFYISYHDGTTNHPSGAVTGSKKWVRVTYTFTTSGTVSNGQFRVYSSSSTSEFWVDGFQCEQKSYATPFDSVNVDGSTARSAQSLKIPTAGNFPGMSGGTILMSLRPDWAYNYSRANAEMLYSIHNTLTNRWNLDYGPSGDTFRFYMTNGAETEIASATQSFSRGDKILLIATWDGSNGDLWTNGVQSATGTKTQRDIDFPANMIIGAWEYALGSYVANSIFDEFAIFDEPFTQRMVDHVYNELFSKGKPLLQAGYWR